MRDKMEPTHEMGVLTGFGEKRYITEKSKSWDRHG